MVLDRFFKKGIQVVEEGEEGRRGKGADGRGGNIWARGRGNSGERER